MADELKTRYSNEEDIPEGLRPYAENKSGTWVINVSADESMMRLQGSLDKARRDYRELKEKYSDVDVDRYQELVTKEQQMRNKKLIEEGQIEQLLNERLSSAASDHEKQIKSKDDIIQQLTSTLSERTITDGVRQHLLRAGVDPSMLDIATDYVAKQFNLDERQNPELRDERGQLRYDANGNQYTIASYTRDWLSANPKFMAEAKGAPDFTRNKDKANGQSGGVRVLTGANRNATFGANLADIATGKAQME